MAEIHDLNPTDASNTGRFPENQAPSTLNDGLRALEGLVARYFFDSDTSAVGTLSGSVIQVTANRNSLTLTGTTSNYVANFMQAFTMGANPITGAASLNVDGVGAISLRDNRGASLSSSMLMAGDRCLAVKDGNNNYFRLIYPYSPNALVQGLHTIWVPACAMRPTASNGCATITDVETTSGRPDMQVLDFDTGSDEHAQFQVGFPKNWNEGTVTFRVFWTSTATDTDGVAWGLQGVSVANDATIDVAYGTAVVVTDDNISAAEDCLVTSTSSAVTIASAAADTLTFFRIFRDVSDANDDMAEDARLLGCQIFYTSSAKDDT
jgi:hypothetical protein|tara:strand:- start:3467 stop:4432 length:966 start_codon:yes stop_codon:yes gene_type:complete